jgi:hypothetical protein
MRIINKILSMMLVTLFSVSIAHAETNSLNKSAWYYGLEYYNYHEKDSGHDPLVTVKTNPWPTLVLGYSDYSNLRSTSQAQYPFIYFLEGSFGRNKYTNYDSSTGNGATTKDYKFQTEVSYVSPYNIYAGLGYRYLYDKGDGAGFYDRINTILYVPVGYGLKMSDGSNAKFQFNYLIDGNQESDLSNVSAVYPNVDNKQNSGWGLDFSYVPKNGEWEFYGKYWDIKKSELVSGTVTVNGHSYIGTIWEPQNYTYQIGFKRAF